MKVALFWCIFIARWLLSEVEVHEAIQIESLVSGLLRSATNDKLAICHSDPFDCAQGKLWEESHLTILAEILPCSQNDVGGVTFSAVIFFGY